MKSLFSGILFFSAAFLLLSAGCSRAEKKIPAPDGEYALSIVREFSEIAPRHSGSPGAERAALFLEKSCLALPGFRTKTQIFRDRTPAGITVFRNIVSELPGKSKKFILIGAHYDSKMLELFPDFRGANDGGSGVGALLAMMRVLSPLAGKLPLSLRFVFFDGEECLFSYSENDGLHGSRACASQLAASGEVPLCRAMILLDMVGDADLKIGLPADTDAKLLGILKKASVRTGTNEKLFLSDTVMIDDHIPFQKLGIPSANLIDFSYGPENSWWHTDQDSVDKLSAESLENVMKIVLEAVSMLCEEQR